MCYCIIKKFIFMKKLIKATPELLAEMDALQIFGGVGIQQ